MIRDDWPEFKGVVGAVYGFYRKDRDLTPVTMRMWFEALRAYELTTIRAAFTSHLRNPDVGQFVPMPADLVKLIDGGSNDAALLAWARVDRAARTIGAYRSVVFDDPLIHYAIDNIGGWIHLGGLDRGGLALRAQPVRGALPRRAHAQPAAPLAPHRHHRGREQRPERPCPLPVLLGDTRRCREVLARGFHQPVLESQPVKVCSLRRRRSVIYWRRYGGDYLVSTIGFTMKWTASTDGCSTRTTSARARFLQDEVLDIARATKPSEVEACARCSSSSSAARRPLPPRTRGCRNRACPDRSRQRWKTCG
jgi:hypothetical protein